MRARELGVDPHALRCPGNRGGGLSSSPGHCWTGQARAEQGPLPRPSRLLLPLQENLPAPVPRGVQGAFLGPTLRGTRALSGGAVRCRCRRLPTQGRAVPQRHRLCRVGDGRQDVLTRAGAARQVDLPFPGARLALRACLLVDKIKALHRMDTGVPASSPGTLPQKEGPGASRKCHRWAQGLLLVGSRVPLPGLCKLDSLRQIHEGAKGRGRSCR